ncbi:MAG: hypothetical protein FWH43_03230 [Endomicrobia bacterium]|nr:hypothetical protein [Endomicrobiia bacterium]
MKKIILAFALLVLPVTAFAVSFKAAGYDWRPYITMDIAAAGGIVEVPPPDNIPGWELRNATAIGALFNLGAGIKHNRVRTELSYFTRASMNFPVSWIFTGTVSASAEQAGMINFYFDYVSTRVFAMYIGAGGGLSSWNQSTAYLWESSHGGDGKKHTYEREGLDFIYGLYSGISFTVKNRVSFDLGFIYYHTNGLNINSFGGKLGTRYTF